MPALIAALPALFLALDPVINNDCPPSIRAFSPHGPTGAAWVQVVNDGCGSDIVNLSEWAVRWGYEEWYLGGINADDELLYPGACFVWDALPILAPPGECAEGISIYNWCADVLTEDPVDAIALGGKMVCGLSGLGELPDAPWPMVGEAVYIEGGQVVMAKDTGPAACAHPWRDPTGPGDEQIPPAPKPPLKIVGVSPSAPWQTFGGGWVQVKNTSPSPVNLGGWSVRGGHTTFEYESATAATTIAPGDCAIFGDFSMPLGFLNGCALGVGLFNGKSLRDHLFIGNEYVCMEGFEDDLPGLQVLEPGQIAVNDDGWKWYDGSDPWPCDLL